MAGQGQGRGFGRALVVGRYPVSPEAFERVIEADVFDDDGRSPWEWFVLDNGDVLMGTFPRGATYEAIMCEAS